MGRIRAAAGAALALWVSACASSPPPHRAPSHRPPAHRPPAHHPSTRRPAATPAAEGPRPLPSVPVPPPTPPARLELNSLPGWQAEDHLAAFMAWRAGCGVSHEPAAAAVCARARGFSPAGDAEARAFLEANFKAATSPGEGVLTAYYTPRYEARPSPDAEFSAPIRPPPADLVLDLAGGVSPVAPYADRAAIEARPADNALGWMRPEDLFFMQIQGSGVLDFPDGERLKAVTVATNGRPFVGIAAPMRAQGLLPDNRTSGEAIHAWLAAHRGPDAQAITDLDPRYGFFALQPLGGGIVGAAGLPLSPGRAIAVDRSRHALGGFYWLDAEAPALTGARAHYRRAVMALDIGGAIKGQVRADLYIGLGAAAGEEAGSVRHRLRLYELVPVP